MNEYKMILFLSVMLDLENVFVTLLVDSVPEPSPLYFAELDVNVTVTSFAVIPRESGNKLTLIATYGVRVYVSSLRTFVDLHDTLVFPPEVVTVFVPLPTVADTVLSKPLS